jgi:uncharacterized protein DUF4232
LDLRPLATGCTAADLISNGVSTGAAMGTQRYLIKFRNAGTKRCSLAGRPALLFTDAGTARTAQISPVTYSGAAPNSMPATIDPGEAAWLDLETYGGCFTSENQTRVVIEGGTLRLADGSLLPLASTLDATCGVGMSEWFRPPPQQPMLPWTDLVVTITAPASANVDQTLEYVVTLTNPADTPLPLRPCPNYTQTLASPGATIAGGAARQLNCVGDTVPGRSAVQFEMRLNIPSGAVPGGSVSLHWALGFGDTAEPMPSATVSLTLLP